MCNHHSKSSVSDRNIEPGRLCAGIDRPLWDTTVANYLDRQAIYYELKRV